MRIRWTLISAALAIVLAGPRGVVAQDGPASDPARAAERETAPVFRSETELVLLDIVVRDKKGRPVLDLAPGEVEVLEDGVRQQVLSFRHVGGAPQQGAPTPAASAGAEPRSATAENERAPRLVVLAFDRLSIDGRQLAQDAALEFVKRQMSQDVRITVARLGGGRAFPVQVGISDPATARQAVRLAVTGLVGKDSGPPTQGQQQQATTSALSAPNSAEEATPERVRRLKSQGIEGSLGEQTLSQSYDTDTLHGLGDLVVQVRSTPGRKTLLFFSEGLVIPPGRDHLLRNVISAANLANVSIYALDVRGLDLTSQLSAARSALEEASRISQEQRLSGTADNPVTQRHAGQDDVTLTSLRSNVVSTLEELSTSTGGLLTTETNDFSRGIARIGADLREYYEVAYRPPAAAGASEYRRIDVRVARKGLRVRSRHGYLTSPLAAPQQALAPTVAAALQVLLGETLPREIEMLSAILRFDPLENAVEHMVRLEVPLAQARLREDAAAGRFTGRLTIVGRLRDQEGALVDVFGQEYPLAGTLAETEALRATTVRYERRLRLAPGRHTIEWVVRDADSGKATAERRTLTVGVPAGHLSLSSLVIVAGVAAAGSASDPSDPLLIADSLLTPNLGSPVVPSAGRDVLPLYCIVYHRPEAGQTATATVELSRDGKLLARGSAPLAKPDAQGRTQYLSTIPLRDLTPGEYLVRLVVSDGAASAEETATLRVGS